MSLTITPQDAQRPGRQHQVQGPDAVQTHDENCEVAGCHEDWHKNTSKLQPFRALTGDMNTNATGPG